MHLPWRTRPSELRHVGRFDTSVDDASCSLEVKLSMFLAWREMRRAKVRFGMLAAAVGLFVFLVLFQQALRDGLITAFVGGIENQSAPVLVYSVEGRRNLQGSAISADIEEAVRAAPGVARVGRIGQGTFTVTVDGGFEDATIIGYETAGLGSPRDLVEGRLPTGSGEAVANADDADVGFGLGDRFVVEPGGLEIVVVGRARDISLNVTPTVFTTYGTFVAAVAARNPDAVEPFPNALAIAPAPGVSDRELEAVVNAAHPDADALTRSRAAALTPGVSQVSRSFDLIFALYASVVPLVTGLFFLIVTLQKKPSLTLLRAIGAPPSRLVSTVLIQAGTVIAGGLLLGTALFLPVTRGRVGDLAIRFDPMAVVFWGVLLLVLGVASAWFAGRRILAIEPVAATRGTELGQ
jgi:putative ABC transport system permease protein